jgi:hypothetical protein
MPGPPQRAPTRARRIINFWRRQGDYLEVKFDKWPKDMKMVALSNKKDIVDLQNLMLFLMVVNKLSGQNAIKMARIVDVTQPPYERPILQPLTKHQLKNLKGQTDVGYILRAYS